MAQKAFMSKLEVFPGDLDGQVPINPAQVSCLFLVIRDDDTIVPGPTAAQVEITYSSTLLSIKSALQNQVRALYGGDPLMLFTWVDDKGLI